MKLTGYRSTGTATNPGPVEVVAVYLDDDGNEHIRPLNPRRDLWNHSPDGFQYGYAGSGPSQLALAITAHIMGYDGGGVTREEVFDVYMDLKAKLIRRAPRNRLLVLSAESVKRVIEEARAQKMA